MLYQTSNTIHGQGNQNKYDDSAKPHYPGPSVCQHIQHIIKMECSNTHIRMITRNDGDVSKETATNIYKL